MAFKYPLNHSVQMSLNKIKQYVTFFSPPRRTDNDGLIRVLIDRHKQIV